MHSLRPHSLRHQSEIPQEAHAERLVTLTRQAVHLPLPAALAAAVVALAIWSERRDPLIWSWWLLLPLLLVVRAAWCRRLVAPARPPDFGALRVLAALNAVTGAAAGSVSLVYFADLALSTQALVTVVLLGLVAGAVPASHSSPRLFAAFAMAPVLMLCLSWTAFGRLQPAWLDWVMAGLVAACFLVIHRFAADSEEAWRGNFQIRKENQQLLEALRATNAEVARQRDLAEAANLAKSRFLAAASHDLRQPLHALTLYAESLVARPLDQGTRELATHIRRGLTDSLSPLLERLLDISRLDAGGVEVTPSAVESAPIIAQMQQEFGPAATAAGGSLVVNEDALLTLWVDPVLFCRILRNLLDNAVKHAGARDIVLDISRRQDRGLIRICDQGPGIAERDQGRVFEEFYQVDNPGRDRTRGLGLGLAIVHRLCRLQDIGLELESAPGLGTCFALRPPTLAVLCANRYVFAPAPAYALLPGLRILVVDDEAPIRAASADLLDAWGCRCDSAAGLAEAKILINRRRFDVLLADYQLTDGASGMQVVEYARRMQPGIACFMVSGDMNAGARADTGSASQAPVHWLVKPVHPAALHQALQQVRGP